MRKILLATSALLCFGNVASADMSFVQGSTSFGYVGYQNFSYSVFVVSTNAAFSVENWGYQFGGVLGLHPRAEDLYTFTAVDLHFYRETQNGTKFGVFINTLGFGYSGSGMFDTGVEGMFALGPVDIEASLGLWLYDGEFDDGTFDLDIYYDLSDRIGVNGGINSRFQIGGSGFDILYGIGASYNIPNSGLVATAGYSFFDGFENGIVQIGLTLNFGQNQDGRLFNHGSGVISDGFFF